MVALLRPAVDSAGRRHSGKTPPRGGLRLVVDNTTTGDPVAGNDRSPVAGLDRSVLLTAGVAALVVFGSLFALRLAQDVTVEGAELAPVATPGAEDGYVAEDGHVAEDGYVPGPGDGYVVAKPGDSLWSIARTIAPDSDIRPVVAALVEANGDDSIRIGQQIVIPQQLLD